MNLVLSIFLLLSAGVKQFSAQNVDCSANCYENDLSLLPMLNGFLYNVGTSVADANVVNEVTKCTPIDGHVIIRTASENSCCRTSILDITDFTFVYATDEGCPNPVNESGHIKLLAANLECVLLWTCRSTREGVFAFCSHQKVSKKQEKWISAQFERLGLTKYETIHDIDHKNGKCFKNCHGR